MRASSLCAVLLVGAVWACSAGTTTGSTDGGVGEGGAGEDGGGGTTDGSVTTDGGADAASCPAYDDTNKACTTASDCTTVARGCYCGAQPVIGISKSIGAAAATCEANAAAHCALGCANFPGQVAEDGKNNADGGTITVLCDQNRCHTVLQ